MALSRSGRKTRVKRGALLLPLPLPLDFEMPARIQTALTRLLNIRVPVVCAPMAGAAGGLLAAGVARGGGFGFVAAVRPSPPFLRTADPHSRDINLSRTSSPRSLSLEPR